MIPNTEFRRKTGLLNPSLLSIYFNGHVRADPAAHCAARTLFRTIEDDKMGTHLVEVVGKHDQFLRANRNAKLAPFTPFPIDHNLPSHSFPVGPICAAAIADPLLSASSLTESNSLRWTGIIRCRATIMDSRQTVLLPPT